MSPKDHNFPTRIVVVMGVSGSGKTTIGMALACRLGWMFYDADDFHSKTNVEKMRRGCSLTDEDRLPWLASLNAKMRSDLEIGKPLVLACSALKQSYRDLLSADLEDAIRFVYLKGDFALIYSRLQRRSDHFMRAEMLKSQFSDLEEPVDAVTVRIEDDVEKSTHMILQALH